MSAKTRRQRHLWSPQRKTGGARTRRGQERKEFVESEGRKTLGLNILDYPRRNVGQEFAELLPALAARCLRLISGEQQAEIVAETSVYGVLEIDLQNLWGSRAFGSAAQERALRTWEGDTRRRGTSAHGLSGEARRGGKDEQQTEKERPENLW